MTESLPQTELLYTGFRLRSNSRVPVQALRTVFMVSEIILHRHLWHSVFGESSWPVFDDNEVLFVEVLKAHARAQGSVDLGDDGDALVPGRPQVFVGGQCEQPDTGEGLWASRSASPHAALVGAAFSLYLRYPHPPGWLSFVDHRQVLVDDPSLRVKLRRRQLLMHRLRDPRCPSRTPPGGRYEPRLCHPLAERLLPFHTSSPARVCEHPD